MNPGKGLPDSSTACIIIMISAISIRGRYLLMDKHNAPSKWAFSFRVPLLLCLYYFCYYSHAYKQHLISAPQHRTDIASTWDFYQRKQWFCQHQSPSENKRPTTKAEQQHYVSMFGDSSFSTSSTISLFILQSIFLFIVLVCFIFGV